jgi:hypothetical protein
VRVAGSRITDTASQEKADRSAQSMIYESAAVIATAAKKETPVEAALTEIFAVFAGDRQRTDHRMDTKARRDSNYKEWPTDRY